MQKNNLGFRRMKRNNSVGYRVNSVRATQFRQWATRVLRDYVIHGRTAAELIKSRADATREHMGLTSWENAPHGKILKSDVTIAKNYLTKEELEALGRIVSACLDLAEDMARRRIPMTMEDWTRRLDMFLEISQRDILQDACKVTAEIVRNHAESEFEKYRIVQGRLFESDFGRSIKEIERRKMFAV